MAEQGVAEQGVAEQGATQEQLEFLDALRLSGVTNMFGAAPYIVREFGLSKPEARKVLLYWMDTFEERSNGGA